MASLIGSAILRTQSDERLVALSRTGHQRAFEAIVERYRAELTRSVHRFLPSASVEDVLQQTHLEAWKALAEGTEVRELRAWLHRIARNAAISVASRGYDYDELKDALQVAPGPEDELERREAVRRALRGIAELPERQREALLAVAVGGRSHAEVAFDLGITDTAARQLVRRARVSLQALATIAIPPQLVIWAARAGHTAVVGTGHTVAAGKAAAGAGLGGGLTGPGLKLGAVAIAVGGVAAGVAPLRHALAPSPPAAPHHHRRARVSRPSVYLAATPGRPTPRRAVRLTAAAGVPAAPGPARRHGAHRLRSVSANPLGKPAPGIPAESPGQVPAATAPTPPPIPAAATAGSAAAPQSGLAALIAWAIAHSSQTTTGAGAAAAYSGWSVGTSTPGSAGQGSSSPDQTGQDTPTSADPSYCSPAAGTPDHSQPPGSAGAGSTTCASASATTPWTYVSQFFSAPKQKTN